MNDEDEFFKNWLQFKDHKYALDGKPFYSDVRLDAPDKFLAEAKKIKDNLPRGWCISEYNLFEGELEAKIFVRRRDEKG